jgi:hypothetical protein
MGRARGGPTTKVHALTDGRGQVLAVLLAAGSIDDTTMFAPLLAALRVARAGPGRPRRRPGYLVADKAVTPGPIGRCYAAAAMPLPHYAPGSPDPPNIA